MRHPVPRFSLVAAILSLAVVSGGGCYLLESPYADYGVPYWGGGFGYASVGLVGYSDFFGEIEGVGPGLGLTITVPPLGPGLFVLACVAVAEGAGGSDPFTVLGATGEEGFWLSGVQDSSRHIISDFSIDLSFSWSQHRDRDFGGTLNYTSWLLGVRLGGPRMYQPRYYMCGGWGWYWFDYDAPPPGRYDAAIGGPYWGFGLELFSDEDAAVGVEYKMHFYFGDNKGGVPVDGGVGQLSLLLARYW